MKLLPSKLSQILLRVNRPKKNLQKKIFNRSVGRQVSLLLAIFLASLILTIIFTQIFNPDQKKITLAQNFNVLREKFETKKTQPFSIVHITAKSAVVYDLTTNKTLYEKNSNRPLPLASLTKLMTALIASRELDQSDLVQLFDDNSTDIWHAKELTEYTLVNSYNLGASALAMATANKAGKNFVDLMNEEKTRLGLTTLRFYNETGLDVSNSIAGGYGSALDVAKFHSYLVKNYPEIVAATSKPFLQTDSASQTHYTAFNTNTETNKFPGLISSKTGTTPLAGANLSIVFDAGLAHPVAIVILGSTEEERFNDAKKLTEATMAYLAEERR